MRNLIIVLSAFVLFGCSSTTYIKTIPSGARVYDGDVLKGFTPYMYWDREAFKHSKTFTLQKEGYKNKSITIQKTDFNPLKLIAPPILSLPWIYDYPFDYVFELERSGKTDTESAQSFSTSSKSETQPKSSNPSGYSQKLRDLKKLKDEGLLTEKEYEQKRRTIIEGI